MHIYELNIRKITPQDEEKVKKLLPQRFSYCKKFLNHDDYLRSLGASLLMIDYLKLKDETNLQYEENGKPFLKNGPKFNYSHSGDLVILVISKKEVGVDVQKIEEKNLKYKEGIFSKEELEFINKDPLNNFHVMWTQKEALMKLYGLGLKLKPINIKLSDFKEVKFKSFIKDNYAITIAEKK